MVSKKKLLLPLAVFITLGILSVRATEQFLYPDLNCSGKFNKNKKWIRETGNKLPKILENENLDLSWSVLIRRDSITIENDRFPFYKELSHIDNFAKKTNIGITGGYKIDFIQHYKYEFTYNKITNQLTVELNARGKHVIENEVGDDILKATFLGKCERKWL